MITTVRLLVICLTLGAGATIARADLKFQPKMEAVCRPATPVTYSPLRYQDQGCSECFISRVTCSNGKSFELRTNLHPGTTTLQAALYEWLPWSVLLYLLPFALLIALGTVASQLSPWLIALNVLFVGYGSAAAWSLYLSVTASPGAASGELLRLAFLNPWVYGAVVGFFALFNIVALVRGFESFFYHHPPVPSVVPLHPFHAASVSAALMPQLHEFTDPRETASHYHRETGRIRALKDRLEAQTALANAVLRHERARNRADHDA